MKEKPFIELRFDRIEIRLCLIVFITIQTKIQHSQGKVISTFPLLSVSNIPKTKCDQPSNSFRIQWAPQIASLPPVQLRYFPCSLVITRAAQLFPAQSRVRVVKIHLMAHSQMGLSQTGHSLTRIIGPTF